MMYIVSKKHSVKGFDVGRLFNNIPIDYLMFNDFMPCDGSKHLKSHFPELAYFLSKHDNYDSNYFSMPYIERHNEMNVYNCTIGELWTKLNNWPEYKFVKENFL